MKSKIIWSLVIVGGLLLLVYWGGSYYFSDILIDSETATLAESQARLEDVGLPDLPAPEDVTIDADEVTLSGFFYDNERGGECAVMILHGYTSTRYGSLLYAPLFWDRGCDVLVYDARGHGDSSDAYHTYGYHEKEDGLAAYEWLQEKTGLEPEQIGLAGVSYGAATALQMLPLTPEAAFVLADSPYQDLRTIVNYQGPKQFGAWVKLFIPGATIISEIRANFKVAEVSPKNAIQDTAVPVLLIHSTTDTFTPPSNSETIYANSNPEITELHLNEWGSAHARDIITDYEAYARIVDAFLAEQAPGWGAATGGR
ncbi:MAG: alpha/beta fold hydrolase [Chloroflexi bacterium]|nr:alpha/beta fold hydrolase [Chloroflexota bacterium]